MTTSYQLRARGNALIEAAEHLETTMWTDCSVHGQEGLYMARKLRQQAKRWQTKAAALREQEEALEDEDEDGE